MPVEAGADRDSLGCDVLGPNPGADGVRLFRDRPAHDCCRRLAANAVVATDHPVAETEALPVVVPAVKQPRIASTSSKVGRRNESLAVSSSSPTLLIVAATMHV